MVHGRWDSHPLSVFQLLTDFESMNTLHPMTNFTIKLSSNSSVYSTERAAAQVGVSHVTLRNWAERGYPEAAKPLLYLNDKQPVYTEQQIEQMREFLEKGR